MKSTAWRSCPLRWGSSCPGADVRPRHAKEPPLLRQKPSSVHHLPPGHIATLYLTPPRLEPRFMPRYQQRQGTSLLYRLVLGLPTISFSPPAGTIGQPRKRSFRNKVARTLGTDYPGGPAGEQAPKQTVQSIPAHPMWGGAHAASASPVLAASCSLNLGRQGEMEGGCVGNWPICAAPALIHILDILTRKPAGRRDLARKTGASPGSISRQRPAAGATPTWERNGARSSLISAGSGSALAHHGGHWGFASP